MPAPLLRELGVAPMGKRKFLLADGRRIEMDYGQAGATIDGDSVVTIVVFGDEEAPALLGAYTLEGLSLAVDPGRATPGFQPTSSCIRIWDASPSVASFDKLGSPTEAGAGELGT